MVNTDKYDMTDVMIEPTDKDNVILLYSIFDRIQLFKMRHNREPSWVILDRESYGKLRSQQHINYTVEHDTQTTSTINGYKIAISETRDQVIIDVA